MTRRYIIRDKVTKEISYAPGFRADFRTVGTAEIIFMELDNNLQKPYLEIYDTKEDGVVTFWGNKK